MSEKEMVNHPAHYNAHPSGVECIDIIEHFGYNVGVVIKHLWRADEKHDDGGMEDLRKAEWYIKREIEKRVKDEKRRKEEEAKKPKLPPCECC
jgi:hypothetical protein